ncbi:MAG: hopanoid biosynthesis-associated protein HpnK [Verrucomicrobiae bacterium]|nr:hopanoid biosynthesis-associated protein HpnK [Verrucomicrobiae bacterium]
MRRLIVNADDLGRTAEHNAAVEQAHVEGILTSASLMVNEPAAGAAVAMARGHPGLAVGLHVTLIQGRAALPAGELGGLVDEAGQFGRDPVVVGWRYFWRRDWREPLRRELEAQLGRFRETGLRLDHVNGHLHLHQQPVVFKLLLELAPAWGIRHVRVVREPLGPNWRAARGRYGVRLLHAGIFAALGRGQRRALARRGIRCAGAVFGQLQDGRVDEAYVLGLLPHLPAGDSELYSHPTVTEFKHELDALCSPRVKALVGRLGLQLIHYGDL